MRFAVERVYDEADFIGFMQAYTNKDKRLRIMGNVSRWCVLGTAIVLLASGVINLGAAIISKTAGVRYYLLPAGMILLGGFLLTVKTDTMSGKKAWKKYPGQGAKILYEFDPSGYSFTVHGIRTEKTYDVIETLCEDERSFYLFVGEATAEIISKAGFVRGDPDSFRTFIQDVTGLEFISAKKGGGFFGGSDSEEQEPDDAAPEALPGGDPSDGPSGGGETRGAGEITADEGEPAEGAGPGKETP